MSAGPELPAWAAGLPYEAVPQPSEVTQRRPDAALSFEGRWRMMTIARLYGRCGWTHARIAAHFGFGNERARQLVRAAGYWGRRGKMESLDPAWWTATRGF